MLLRKLRFWTERFDKISITMRNGEIFQTKIGADGRAVMERNYSVHHKPWAHTNLHDHIINWDNPSGFPDPQPPINYPNGAPEFKQFGGENKLKSGFIPANTIEQNRFETISDFKCCMRWHGETEFVWKGVTYSITHYDNNISISHSGLRETEMKRKTADEILEYMVGDDRLRDIITKVHVVSRSI